MGLLRDLTAARDLVVEVTAGLDAMGRAMAQVSRNAQAPLGPGGGTFDLPPGTPPGQPSPLPGPTGLQPFVQAGTILLGPNGQPVAVAGWGNAPKMSSRGGGGGGGGGRRTGLSGVWNGGGSAVGGQWGGATISTGGGGGGGGTLVNGMTPGTLATAMKGSVAEPVVTSLQEIRDELRAMRQEQRNATGLRAAGIA